MEGLGLAGTGDGCPDSDKSFSPVGLASPSPKLVVRPTSDAMPPSFSSSGNVVIPASSLIRTSLNLSLRLLRAGLLLPFTPSVSFPSSNLPNIISGLLPIVAIEDAVFLRSFGDGRGGDWTLSFDWEFRDSQANGLVNFLVGGGGAGRVAGATCAWGGAAQGTDGRAPDRPCSTGTGFVDRGGGGGGVFSKSKSQICI